MPMTFQSSIPVGGEAVPFNRISDPAKAGLYLTLNQSETLRLSRYSEAWRFYFGRHWGFAREDGEALVTLNYYRKVIDKLSEFLVGKGFVITVPESLEETTKPYMDEVWDSNQREVLGRDISVMGGVTGDSFISITNVPPTQLDMLINPMSQGRTKITLHGSEQVFPTWDPLDLDRMLKVRIEHIFQSDNEVPTRGTQVDREGKSVLYKRFTQIITPGQIMEQYHGEIPSIKPNILGEIPVVHIKNLTIPRENYGMSDGQDLIDLNRQLNEKSTDVSDIINYHAAPITVVTGAKMKNVERGPRTIWSGLPANASVFNLKQDGDLIASQSYLDRIKRSFHEISDVPEGVLGERQPISNTSGVALHIQYQPILGRTKRKRDTYEPGFQRINYFILRIGVITGRVKLPYDLCASCGGRILEYDDPTGKTEWLWDEQSDQYLEKVRRIKKCFHVNKQNLDFMEPNQMRVKLWRQYGVGDEFKEVTLEEAKKAAKGHTSFWDYSADLGKKLREWEDEVRRIRASNQSRGDGTPQEAEPGPPDFGVKKLPEGEVISYEEPQEVVIQTQLKHPRTGEVVKVISEKRTLVPTGCLNPRYQNPYENHVSFNEVLPKDEALQAALYEIYQRNQWVDPDWVQARIPDIAEDQTNIRRRMRLRRPIQTAHKRSVTADTQTLVDNLTSVPGADGNPIKIGTQV